MKTIAACALLVLLPCTAVSASDTKKPGVTLSFNSDDSRTKLAPRHTASDSRIAITSRSGSTVLLMTNDVVAIQLSDATIDKIRSSGEEGFLEELIVSGVRFAMRKAVEFPLAGVKSIEVRDGMLHVTSDQNKPVFDNVKVNGSDVFRDFSPADATRFANAFRAIKRR